MGGGWVDMCEGGVDMCVREGCRCVCGRGWMCG